MIKQKVIFYLRGLLTKLDFIHFPTKYLYEFYYKVIIYLLQNDFKVADEQIKLKSIPKSNQTQNFVWFMWWQGMENAPQIVRVNYKRVKKLFGDDNVVLISKSNYKDFTDVSNEIISKVNKGEITFTQWSDILRFNLLKNHGGMWIDSTVIVSNAFVSYFNQKKKEKFFSICSDREEYHYISHSLWTSWLCGGSPNYELFIFMDEFFKTYFRNHQLNVDYYLIDDAIYYYYLTHTNFQRMIGQQRQYWEPYLFVNNFSKKSFNRYLYMFSKEREYSVQKFSYKGKFSLLPQKDTLFYKIIENDID